MCLTLFLRFSLFSFLPPFTAWHQQANACVCVWIFDISRNYRHERRSDSTHSCVLMVIHRQNVKNCATKGETEEGHANNTIQHISIKEEKRRKKENEVAIARNLDEDGNAGPYENQKSQIDFWWAFTLLFSYSEYVFASFFRSRSFDGVQSLLLKLFIPLFCRLFFFRFSPSRVCSSLSVFFFSSCVAAGLPLYAPRVRFDRHRIFHFTFQEQSASGQLLHAPSEYRVCRHVAIVVIIIQDSMCSCMYEFYSVRPWWVH